MGILRHANTKTGDLAVPGVRRNIGRLITHDVVENGYSCVARRMFIATNVSIDLPISRATVSIGEGENKVVAYAIDCWCTPALVLFPVNQETRHSLFIRKDADLSGEPLVEQNPGSHVP